MGLNLYALSLIVCMCTRARMHVQEKELSPWVRLDHVKK